MTETTANPLINLTADNEVSKLEQFNWVSNWLSKNKLFKTLDSLLLEYNEVLETNFLGQAQLDIIPEFYPLSELRSNFSSVHSSAILAVQFHPTFPWIFSSDTLKNLIVTSYEGEQPKVLSSARSNNPFSGSIISISVNPVYTDLVLIGTMDENHALLRVTPSDNNNNSNNSNNTNDNTNNNGNNNSVSKVTVTLLQKWKIHQKYVIRVKWSNDGKIFATASHDKSIAFFQLDDNDNSNNNNSSNSSSKYSSAKQMKQIYFSGQVEAIEFTKDSKYLIVAVRGEPHLFYVELNTWNKLTASVNSTIGDPHVSFNILSLNLSPDGNQVLVCTDKSRSIMFQTQSPIQIHNFYGFPNDGFSQPRAAFDNSGLIYLSAQDNKVHVFDSKTEIKICELSGHTAVVRDLHYNKEADLLVTCSYDKTIKIWKRQLSPQVTTTTTTNTTTTTTTTTNNNNINNNKNKKPKKEKPVKQKKNDGSDSDIDIELDFDTDDSDEE